MAAGEGNTPAWFRPVLVPKQGRWDIWVGVSRLHYGWRRFSSPPKVLRAVTLAGLKSKIRAEERRRNRGRVA
jgi:hypothetical protein